MVAKAKFTQEEELLLQDFSRNVSKKNCLIFYIYAFVVSAIPICKYPCRFCLKVMYYVCSYSVKSLVIYVLKLK